MLALLPTTLPSSSLSGRCSNQDLATTPTPISVSFLSLRTRAESGRQRQDLRGSRAGGRHGPAALLGRMTVCCKATVGCRAGTVYARGNQMIVYTLTGIAKSQMTPSRTPTYRSQHCAKTIHYPPQGSLGSMLSNGPPWHEDGTQHHVRSLPIGITGSSLQNSFSIALFCLLPSSSPLPKTNDFSSTNT